MKTEVIASDPAIRGWDAIHLEGELSPTQARGLLKLHFSDHDIGRMQELAAKSRAGSLAPAEIAQIDAYERLGCLLDILHSKARQVLKRRKPLLFTPFFEKA